VMPANDCAEETAPQTIKANMKSSSFIYFLTGGI
jgi:hypothetical protein